MSPRILRRVPFVLALATTLWVAWNGILIWRTPIVWEGVAAQTLEEAAQQPPTVLREGRRFGDASALGAVPLIIPVILAAGAALITRLHAPDVLAVVVVLFLGYVFITGFSIGGAYHGPALLLGITLLADIVLWWTERRRTAAA